MGLEGLLYLGEEGAAVVGTFVFFIYYMAGDLYIVLVVKCSGEILPSQFRLIKIKILT